VVVLNRESWQARDGLFVASRRRLEVPALGGVDPVAPKAVCAFCAAGSLF
jgi:hypothetical protein